MKKITLILIILIFSTLSFSQDNNVPNYVNMENSTDLVNQDGFYEYMILKGDYLWKLAGKFYNDPYKWSDINNANPYIVDPNWIYPNNWLVIPNVFTDDYGKPIYFNSGKSTLITGVAIDLDDDGIVDGVDLDGDDMIDTEAGIDLDGDGVIDGYDTDGDGNIDILAGATAAATGIIVDNALENEDLDAKKSCVKSYCGKPGWKLGLHAGYPIGGGPEDENLNLGLLLGTPLGVKVGPLSV